VSVVDEVGGMAVFAGSTSGETVQSEAGHMTMYQHDGSYMAISARVRNEITSCCSMLFLIT
jgi:hypothetical protein